MSFVRRSVVRLAERADVAPSLKKWWKKHVTVNGEITEHLSPNELNIVTPLFKDVHTKVFKKVSHFLMEAGPGLLVGIATYYWADWKHKQIAYHHRH